MVNVVALAVLVGGAMFLGRYQDRLIATGLAALHTEARIFAGALGEGAVLANGAELRLDGELSRRMVRRLVEPTEVRSRLYDLGSALLADSLESASASEPVTVSTKEKAELPPPSRWVFHDLERLYVFFAGTYPHREEMPVVEEEETTDTLSGPGSRIALALTGLEEVAPKSTRNGDLVLTATVPVRHGSRVIGALLLTESGDNIEAAVQTVREEILRSFGGALLVTVLLSLYLAGTIVGPIRRLALAAERVRRSQGRNRSIPNLTARRDEIGDLSLALREMTAALSERMDAIERFAADVAHEIKNPLSSLRSAVETAARIEDPERRRPLMAIIEDDVKRLDRLITDIASASRVDTELSRANVAPVDLRAILTMLAEIHAVTTISETRGVRLVAELPDASNITLDGVESRLVQVFQNLIANALSFSPPGGTVTMQARRNGPMVEITITDQGPGIPESKLEAIFDRFYTERPAGEKFGTHSGLGLSISRQIIEAHHGTITAANRTPEQGAVFTVRLPVRRS